MLTSDFWKTYYEDKAHFHTLYRDYQVLKAKDRTDVEEVQFGAASRVISKHMET